MVNFNKVNYKWVNLLSRRQDEVDKYKEDTGITEVDVESYAKTQLAARAENLLGSPLGRLRRLSVDEQKLVEKHLITSLVVENLGRNSEVTLKFFFNNKMGKFC